MAVIGLMPTIASCAVSISSGTATMSVIGAIK
jgi:hypothetical protein